MSLTQALSTALSGLNVTQTDLSVVSANIANANTPGYVEKTSVQVETVGDSAIGVNTAGVSRQLDELLQSQVRVEQSGASYADLKSQFYQQLQQIYGTPGSTSAIDSAYNAFTSALQTLSTSPDSYSAQSGVVTAAQALAQKLNSMTTSIQGLRTEAEQGIAADVQQANNDLQQIAQINQQLSTSGTQDTTSVTLEDQRDKAIDDLSKLMNIRVAQGQNNQISVFTGSGQQLVGTQAATLSFDNRGSLSATSLWNADPTKSGVGTITLTSPSGATTDLIANNSIQSGEIAGYLEMRDKILPQAQSQLDELAAQMSEGLSNRTTSGTAVTSGAQAGYNIDVGGVLPGNSFQVTYTDSANKQHTVTVVRVDDPAALPLTNTATTGNQVIGVNFSGGMSSVVSQLNSALGASLQFSNPSGTTLQVLNAATNTTTVTSVSATTTATTLAGGSTQLPFFVDGNSLITGAITAAGSQDVGLAGRISVNSALVADPSKTVVYQTSPMTSAGDPTRPNFLLSQLTTTSLVFSPTTGIGSQAAPFTGTLPTYMSQVVSQQGQAATNASNLQQGQDAVLTALQSRLNTNSGVNIDQEMSNLINLQNTYAANARVMTTIQQMMSTLMQIGT